MHIEEDVENFKVCMEKYLFKKKDTQLLLDPTGKDLDIGTAKITATLKVGKHSNPATKTLIIALIAGLGINYAGAQALVQNQFQKNGVIKTFKAEAKLQAWAEIFQNSYIIAIFACDRTDYAIGRNFGNN